MPFAAGMDKGSILSALIEVLEQRKTAARRASEDAIAYATDEESKADSKWDTQGLEASYLAAGQANQVRSLHAAVQKLRSSISTLVAPVSSGGVGALVVSSIDGARDTYFVAPEGGGEILHVGGQTITVITPESPLYLRLLHRRAGEKVVLPSGAVMQVEAVE